MNKYQEALARIEKTAFFKTEHDFDNFRKDAKLLQELLDKTTPMKPKIYIDNKKESKRVYACPRCGNSCLKKWANERQVNRYCWDCGQALDWSEDESK